MYNPDSADYKHAGFFCIVNSFLSAFLHSIHLFVSLDLYKIICFWYTLDTYVQVRQVWYTFQIRI